MTAPPIEEMVKAGEEIIAPFCEQLEAFEVALNAALARAKELNWELTYKKVEK